MRARFHDVAAFQAGTSKRDPGLPRAGDGEARARKEPAHWGLLPALPSRPCQSQGWGPEEKVATGGPGDLGLAALCPQIFPTVGF